ncbi:MAG: low molecular weight phosphotyrosine protein phosphatase [Bacteroidales bacterium]|nr:low molecular weight phosphotyrosine protein phosphatase [Bacteroidales bacterium]
MESHKKKLLFVCLGNICRSPLADTIMNKLVEDRGLTDKYEIDSAGILDYHEGDKADYRMRCHAGDRGYFITHLSRPVVKSDFDEFDLIFGMDDQNIRDLESIATTDEQRAKIHRMVDYCPNFGKSSVPDPYYGGEDGFKLVIDMLEVACANLLDELENNKN